MWVITGTIEPQMSGNVADSGLCMSIYVQKILPILYVKWYCSFWIAYSSKQTRLTSTAFDTFLGEHVQNESLCPDYYPKYLQCCISYKMVQGLWLVNCIILL